MKHTSDFKHVEIAHECEPTTVPFQTNLDWNERAELRMMLKAVSQLPGFNRQERELAMRLISELDQLQLEF